jgi:hypothetical protein
MAVESQPQSCDGERNSIAGFSTPWWHQPGVVIDNMAKLLTTENATPQSVASEDNAAQHD